MERQVAAGPTAGWPAVLLRTAAVPLAIVLALAGQLVLAAYAGRVAFLIAGAALLAVAALLLGLTLLRRPWAEGEEPAGSKRSAGDLPRPAPAVEWTLLAIVLLGGLWLRLYRIDLVPPGLNNDEAINALETREILAGRPFTTLTKTGLNRETMFHYLAAASFKFGEIELNLLRAMPAVFGLTPRYVGDPLMDLVFPLRAVSIAAGTLTLLALYLFGRDRFGWLTALLATAFLAVSPWHVLYSRLGERAALAPLFAIATLAFFLKGLETGRTRDHVAWGALLGLGLWSYTSFRVVPIALVIFLLARGRLGWAGDPKTGPSPAATRRGVSIAAGLAGLILAALMLLSGLGPLGFVTRGTYATLVTPGANYPLNVLCSAVMAHFIPGRYAVIQSEAFISDGISPVYGLIGLAPETTIVAVLSALGFLYAVWRALFRRDATCGLLAIAAVALVLTVGVAGPSLTRMLPNLPWLCLFAALIARRLAEDVAALKRPVTVWLGALLLAPLVVWGACQGFANHFLRAGRSTEAMQHFGASQTLMGMFVRTTLPADRKVYVLHTLRVDTLRYLIGDRPNVYLVSDPTKIDLDGIIKMPKTATLLIELARPFAEAMRYLIMRYPQGDATQIADARVDPDKIIFYTFTLWKDESGQPISSPEAPPEGFQPGAAPPGAPPGAPIPGDVPPLGSEPPLGAQKPPGR